MAVWWKQDVRLKDKEQLNISDTIDACTAAAYLVTQHVMQNQKFDFKKCAISLF